MFRIVATSGNEKRDYEFDDVLVPDGGFTGVYFVLYFIYIIHVFIFIKYYVKMFLSIC